jgi:hypothetical protein
MLTTGGPSRIAPPLDSAAELPRLRIRGKIVPGSTGERLRKSFGKSFRNRRHHGARRLQKIVSKIDRGISRPKFSPKKSGANSQERNPVVDLFPDLLQFFDVEQIEIEDAILHDLHGFPYDLGIHPFRFASDCNRLKGWMLHQEDKCHPAEVIIDPQDLGIPRRTLQHGDPEPTGFIATEEIQEVQDIPFLNAVDTDVTAGIHDGSDSEWRIGSTSLFGGR